MSNGNSRVLVCGRKPLAESLRHRTSSVLEVLLARGLRIAPTLQALLEEAKRAGVVIREIERQELDVLAAGLNHQGVAAWIEQARPIDLERFLEGERDQTSPAVVVVLDQVTDPHNLGAILRVAEAVGARAAIVTADQSAPLSPAARRASAGASELLPVVAAGNLQRSLERLKDAGYWIVGTDVSPESQ
ncbi:MAG: RNA methyltransferase [Bdellovibrionales bacterium]|nr:RNA methyltransferase [Bdellovibrionales bacterium]